MPDITMCKGEGCKQKDKCYRYTATPSEYRQSWFIKEPYEDVSLTHQECQEFMKIWKLKND